MCIGTDSGDLAARPDPGARHFGEYGFKEAVAEIFATRQQ
ncbi:hypothetical protein ATK36_0797 [Amycolatopsis sulphurea]|uniref:Uncharacterized protein n=1 Tax=Amycolatopsis sulphurea TaxID=76022 RepID=A0A2A9G301_9PSEU|nr:hypothetical protein ATK36_0797 [Amycolatopsis sulphurea]